MCYFVQQETLAFIAFAPILFTTREFKVQNISFFYKPPILLSLIILTLNLKHNVY